MNGLKYVTGLFWVSSLLVSAGHAEGKDRDVVPIPVLSTEEFDGSYEPTCLENGFVGFRPGINPLAAAPVAVAGFDHLHPDLGCESLCPVPYPLAVEVRLDGETAVLSTSKQSLDLNCGELITEMEASTPSGKRAAIKVVQFASRSVPSVIAEEISIRPLQDVSIELVSRIAMNDTPVQVYRKSAYYQTDMWDHAIGVRSDLCQLGIAVVAGGEGITRIGPGTFTTEGKKGSEATFQVLAALVPDFYSPYPDQQSCMMVQRALMIGYERLRAENRNLWQGLWQSRVRIIGDPEAQKAVDLAFYYLHSAAHPSSQLSIAPFALSKTGNYFGHIFWDTDAWMFLPIVLTDPPAGRQIVNFRRRTLESAERIASLYGCQGAQYPWETSPRTGFEDSPEAAHTGWSEQFMGNHVAISQWQYCLSTNDEDYMRESAWPVLKGVADWICSRGVWTDRGFEILDVCGVDELTPDIDNSSHTNLTAKMALEAALACANKLGYAEPKEWLSAAKEMYIPTDESGVIIIPYDGATHIPGQRGYSLGMLQFLLVHNPPVASEQFRATWELEEILRSEQPSDPGNPASPGANGYGSMPMASAAAFFGQREKAREIFHNSWKPYLRGPFEVMAEYRKNDFGNFVTTYGSMLQTTLLGFTGLRIVDGDWQVYPASLPAGWDRIECDRFWVKGKPMKLIAEHGKLATLTPIEVGR